MSLLIRSMIDPMFIRSLANTFLLTCNINPRNFLTLGALTIELSHSHNRSYTRLRVTKSESPTRLPRARPGLLSSTQSVHGYQRPAQHVTMAGRIVVYGGRGALGAACVNHFKSANFWVANIDLNPNEFADLNITVPKEASWVQQEEHVVNELAAALQGQKVNAVICVAGGWAGGNASKELCKQADLMWRQSVWSSTIAAAIASKYLAPGGLLALTGAKAALDGTPGMIGYGMAKAAVHHLTKSLGSKDSGLPENSLAVAIMPVTLDTEMNRKWMPKADFSTWTPLTFVAQLFDKWIKGQERPANGSLVALVTKNNISELLVE